MKYWIIFLIIATCSGGLEAKKATEGLYVSRRTISVGKETYKLVVFKYKEAMTTEEVLEKAKLLKLKKPPVEISKIIRNKFTDEEIRSMGFWFIVIMHKSLKDRLGDDVNYTTMSRDGSETLWLTYTSPDFFLWSEHTGFVFLEG